MGEKDYSKTKGFRILWVFILLIICSAISFAVGRITNNSLQTIPSNISYDSTPNEDMSLYWEVWNMLKDEYVSSESYDQEKMMYGSIKGMVDSYEDPATVFLDPEETADFNEKSAGKLYEGIGAELGKRNGMIQIVSPIEGSPALEYGLKAGDIIYKVNDEEIKSTETIYDVVAKIRGEAGTIVKLTIVRAGAEGVLDFEIPRGQIIVPSISVKKPSDYSESLQNYDSEIAIINISRFTDESEVKWNKEWDSTVNEVILGKYDSVVIDLRNNPGGFFDSAIYSLEEFFSRGTLLAQQSDKDGKKTDFISSRNGKLKDVKMIVLVNEGSASASEIFAGAIQFHGRGKIVGAQTYGKGTAQIVIPFRDSSSLHITVLKWLLPNGQWINPDAPIKPDVQAEPKEEDYETEKDSVLQEAINNLLL